MQPALGLATAGATLWTAPLGLDQEVLIMLERVHGFDGAGETPVLPSSAASGAVPREPSDREGISRRRFLTFAGHCAISAALVPVMLAACAPRFSGAGLRSGTKAQLVFQDCRCLGEQLLFEQFHQQHPNIEVFYTPAPDNFEEGMLTDMEAGTAPDVLAGCCDTLPIWAQKGFLLDLRPYVKADLAREIIDDWEPAQYNSFFARDGMQFALPKYHGALALYYNKDVFDRARIDYPDATWGHDDYTTAMRILTVDSNHDGITERWGSMVDIGWERIQVHVNGWGGHLVDPEDPTRSWMAKPEALTAMEWIRARMWEDKVMASTLDVKKLHTRDAFIQRRLAMVEDGSWALRDILEGADFRIGVAPFPAGPKRRVTLATTDGFAIYANTKYPEAAWELMKFLVSRDYGRAMAEAQLLQPARASLIDEWVDLIRTQYPEQTKELDIAAFAEGQVEGYSVTAEVFANMADARQLTQAAWEEIFTLGRASVDIMKKTSIQIEQAQVGSV
jgi:multiple sugar transport system substrate-binding protein